MIKSLASKGFISRKRSENDERVLIAEITDNGIKLKDEAVKIPSKIGSCVSLSQDEASTLYGLLYKILGQV